LGGRDIRFVHVALLRIDEGLDMAAVLVKRWAGLRSCLAAVEHMVSPEGQHSGESPIDVRNSVKRAEKA